MGTLIYSASSLSRINNELKVIDDLSLDAYEGDIILIKTENDFDKNILFNTLSGLEKIDEGTIRVLGIDLKLNPFECKKEIGIFDLSNNLYPKMTGKELIELVVSISTIDNNALKSKYNNFLEQYNFENIIKDKYSTYNDLAKKELSFFLATFFEPKVLIAKDLFLNLEAKTCDLFKQELIKREEQGKVTIIVTDKNDIPAEIKFRVYNFKNGTFAE